MLAVGVAVREGCVGVWSAIVWRFARMVKNDVVLVKVMAIASLMVYGMYDLEHCACWLCSVDIGSSYCFVFVTV